jgi:hypothetical protein
MTSLMRIPIAQPGSLSRARFSNGMRLPKALEKTTILDIEFI